MGYQVAGGKTLTLTLELWSYPHIYIKLIEREQLEVLFAYICFVYLLFVYLLIYFGFVFPMKAMLFIIKHLERSVFHASSA